MDNIRNIYRKISLLMVAILFIIICSTYIYFIGNIGRIYERHAIENMVEGKKEFLKNIVDNIILEIERVQDQRNVHYKRLIDNTLKTLQDYYDVSPEHYIDLFINFCSAADNKSFLSVSIRDKKRDQILYESGDLIGNALTKEEFSSYIQRTYDDYEISFGVSNEYIDQSTKKIIASRIQDKKFAKDSYIWVNEIKNYDGGDDYAIRVIHPDLVGTEEDYLSTNMTDVMGNFPYQEELEGINKDGEVFANSYFKKINSNDISEKITYAKLYKKYDWIIGTGTHLDDVEAYIDMTTKDINKIIVRIIKHTIGFMLVIFILYWRLVSRIENWYFKKYNRRLKEVFIDPLTKAQNRRSAISYLGSAFKEFKKTGQTPMIMMIDIDDFKKLNDTYGHFGGDFVLKNVVNVITNHIRATDTLYRWGGEEFLLICNGLKEEDVIVFSNKIISTVGKEEFEHNGEKYHVTISMGIDKFDQLDTSYEDGVKRADMAMYKAKSRGKNRACTWRECGINPLDN